MHRELVLVVLSSISLMDSNVHGGDNVESSEVICASSASFLVRSYDGGPSATKLLKQSQELRQQIAEVWLGETSSATWNPRCEIAIHPTRSRYLQSVGPGAAQTSGSSLVQSRDGRIVTRRIDVVADARGEFSSLAHELTHVVLAERFVGKRLPRWLDEGISLLSDSQRKQSLHERDCRQALQRGTALRLAELLSLEQFSSTQQVAAFYGQSHSLVRYLAERDDPANLLAFAEVAMARGYDQALDHCYGIASVAELERDWRARATSGVVSGTKGILISFGR